MNGKQIAMFAMGLNVLIANATSAAQIDRAISEYINEHQHDAIVENLLVSEDVR